MVSPILFATMQLLVSAFGWADVIDTAIHFRDNRTESDEYEGRHRGPWKV